MTGEIINLEQAKIAFERATGSAFEQFVNAFYPTIAGESFIPLGGTKDGGADAFESGLMEGAGGKIFYQSSIQEDFRGKIKGTVARLREFGRVPKTLVYVTAQRVAYIDREEADLSSELDVMVRIRDCSYLMSHVNDSPGTRAAFETYLRPALMFLQNIGATQLLKPSENVTAPAIYVFLRQELDRREGKGNLTDALADGLILWALETTDPEVGRFMTAAEVINRIVSAIPTANSLLKNVIPRRLNQLARKDKDLRYVRWYRKEDYYCLAHEVRARVVADNQADEALRLTVRDGIQNRISNTGKLEPKGIRVAAEIALDAIQRTFEQEGLEFAAFLKGNLSETNMPTISDAVDNALIQLKYDAKQFTATKEAILSALQGAFYNSTSEERTFFSRLSETYTLLFCLNSEPRVIGYFQSMAADFYLYVGTDVLVHALSERYLNDADQRIRNTLKLIVQAGGKLVLTDPVLDEVHAHLEATDYEYVNNFQQIEASITEDVGRNSDKILIRSYYYSRFQPAQGIKGPSTFAQFIEQFCDYSDLHKLKGREQLKRYLLAQFKMSFEDRDFIAKLSNKAEVEALSIKLQSDKKDERLATNDALMALGVYGRRQARGEHSKVSEYGYRTWWLTSEARILKHTKDLVRDRGASYIMRPEFLLNFLTLAPSAAEVRKTFRSVFPTVLGIKLARRVGSSELHKVLDEVAKAQALEPGRREAKISELSDRLKADFYRKYEHNMTESRRSGMQTAESA